MGELAWLVDIVDLAEAFFDQARHGIGERLPCSALQAQTRVGQPLGFGHFLGQCLRIRDHPADAARRIGVERLGAQYLRRRVDLSVAYVAFVGRGEYGNLFFAENLAEVVI